MKRNFSFTDANHNLINIECEITHRNGYKEFTMSGDYGNGLGQIDEHIYPKNESQESLLDFWKKYNLTNITNIKNFEEDLNNLIDVIEEIENEEKGRKVTEEDHYF